MFRIRRGPLVIQTLAVCLAARGFEETEFVTDQRGSELAATLGWSFTNVNHALEAFIATGMEHIWALGKLVALTIQEKPCVQFDGDVLLLKPLPKRIERARLIAQSTDFPQFYVSSDMRTAQGISGMAPGLTAYNGGLLGGADVALVRAYAWAGLDLAEKFRGCPINGTTTSMIIEQYHLGHFAQRVAAACAPTSPTVPSRCFLASCVTSLQSLVGSGFTAARRCGAVAARLCLG